MLTAPSTDDNTAAPIKNLPAFLLKPFALSGPLYNSFDAFTKFLPKLPAILPIFLAVLTALPAMFWITFEFLAGLNPSQFALDVALKKLDHESCAANETPAAAHKD